MINIFIQIDSRYIKGGCRQWSNEKKAEWDAWQYGSSKTIQKGSSSMRSVRVHLIDDLGGDLL